MEFGSYGLIAIVVAVVLFLICRELLCWYWKINEIRDLLQSINDKKSQPFNDGEILRKIDNLYTVLSNIDTHIQNLKSAAPVSTGKVSAETVAEKPSEPPKAPEKTVAKSVPNGFTITSQNGRKFAMKDGRYYCPKCYAVAGSEFATMCSHCGASFME